MGVSRSGFYDWRNREVSIREVSNIQLDKHITRIYHEHAGRYGYRRVCDELRDMGLSASLERVRRRMKRIGLRGFQSIKFKYTTNSKHNLPIAPNLLEQNFNVNAPNTAWVGDITYIRVKQQWLYLAVILDLHSRKVIGWAFGVRINAKLKRAIPYPLWFKHDNRSNSAVQWHTIFADHHHEHFQSNLPPNPYAPYAS